MNRWSDKDGFPTLSAWALLVVFILVAIAPLLMIGGVK